MKNLDRFLHPDKYKQQENLKITLGAFALLALGFGLGVLVAALVSMIQHEAEQEAQKKSQVGGDAERTPESEETGIRVGPTTSALR
jgi:hypothetical protein